MTNDSPSRRQDQFVLRLPDGMRDRIAAAARSSGRSMNAEIVQLLEKYYPPEVSEREVAEAVLYYLNALENTNYPRLRDELYNELMRHKEKIEAQGDFRKGRDLPYWANRGPKRKLDLEP